MRLFPNDSNSPEPLEAVFQWCALTRSGDRKETNDDSYLTASAGAGGAKALNPEGSAQLLAEDFVFAVSDGMGGGRAGDIASSTLLANLSKRIPETLRFAAQGLYPDYIARLQQAIEESHGELNAYAAGEAHLEGMSATISLAWFTPDNLYIGHVGDSRIYLARGAEMEQLTQDHSFAWKQLHRGEISEIQYRQHPRRSALYEVIGGGHEHVCPQVGAHDYQYGDRFLICSDGLIDGLWERHIRESLTDRETPVASLARNLLEQSTRSEASDDTTLILLDILEPGTHPDSGAPAAQPAGN